MRSTDRAHSPAPDELMAYVDGEGSADARAAIETHLASCPACQAIVADQRRLSTAMHAWRVPAAPSALQAPPGRPGRSRWHPSRPLAAGLAAAAILLVAVMLNVRPRPLSVPRAAPVMAVAVGDQPAERTSREAQTPLSANAAQASRSAALADRAGAVAGPPQQGPPRTPAVIRTARLQIVAKDFESARASVESIVSAAAGFIDQLTVTGDTSRARVVRGTLRVPSDRMSDALARLRGLGQVTEDTQGSQDVTDQIVDLDARLAAGRATEQRLTQLLRDRTGRLSDVLEVERELTRVRLDIERLDAERTNVARRVSYATIDITMTEERKASFDGPISLTTRLEVAAVEGIEAAFASITGAVLLLLRVGPVLLLWGAFLAAIWLSLRRFGIRGWRIQDPR